MEETHLPIPSIEKAPQTPLHFTIELWHRASHILLIDAFVY